MIVVLRPVLPPPIQPFSTTATRVRPMLGGEVVRGGESVTPAAHDDRVVLGLRRRAPPLGPPALLTR